ncbi:hypothetical protein [Haloarchaeobius sp. FL176]|uniref:hypothetical protein n=1 Tax=Haloarchaeobius sp. FL176 TaxID=2967129 RepID=UPI002147709D|nr:hypothetical protein [Haloarchaeobius sp. FL176]
MVNADLIPLALLYVDSRRSIDGVTRFQKLVFLGQQEGGLPDKFHFDPDKYGPFSKELHQTLDDLESRELIEKSVENTRSGNERFEYSISPRGRRVIQTILNDDHDVDDIFRNAQKLKKSRNDQSLDRLLRYVYRSYPDYTENSEIKEDLGI